MATETRVIALSGGPVPVAFAEHPPANGPSKDAIAPQDESEWNTHRKMFGIVAATFQAMMCIMFATCADYADVAKETVVLKQSFGTPELDHYYPLYQDVHVMIFVGFGFLMTFLKKYGFSSVGYNFVVSAFAIQWGILVMTFCSQIHNATTTNTAMAKVHMNIHMLIEGDFAAGAVLITMGAVLGKTTPMQLLVIAFLEIIFYGINFTIGATEMQAVDMGGSIFVHTWGAYFGLALSRTLSKSQKSADGEVVSHDNNGSTATSDMFAMIGTVFLWMYWPSFNSAFATGSQQNRVVVNTVLSLSACCITAFAMDNLLRPHNKFNMVSIQNATLAGGVAVGSSSDLVIQPWGAIAIGFCAGILSVVGYVHIQPFLEKRCSLDDTCGVHNLHGLPGLLGAIGGAISAGLAGDESYGENIGKVFPARASVADGGKGRSALEQAAFQIAALVVTLALATFGGILTGMIVKAPCLCLLPPGAHKESLSMPRSKWYKDTVFWEVEGEEEEEA